MEIISHKFIALYIMLSNCCLGLYCNVSIYFLRNEHLDSFYYFKITPRSQMNSLPHMYFHSVTSLALGEIPRSGRMGSKDKYILHFIFLDKDLFVFVFFLFSRYGTKSSSA